MLWRARDVPGLRDGSITVAFRRWTRPQVVVGRPYRTPGGRIQVDALDVVADDDVTDDDARAAGHVDAAALLTDLGPGAPLHRIRFHLLAEPDPRDLLGADDDLGADEVAALAARLARLDRTAPWTAATLAIIGERPGVRAGDLAEALGRERLELKADVRKLKALGLTTSLPVGYRLSPRGAAYVAAAGPPPADHGGGSAAVPANGRAPDGRR